jgi:GLPGLI family protein
LVNEFVKRPAWNAKIGRSWYFRQLLSPLTHLSCSKMKKNLAILFFTLLAASPLAAQRKVSELTLVYDASVTTGSKEPKLADAFDGTTKTVYLKGNMSRAEIVTSIFSTATIHDSRTGNSVVLREVSGQKLLIRMTATNWAEINKRYDSITFTNSEDTKVIAGYRCTKAVATLPDGTTFNVYYTAEIVPENKEYDYQFKNLNGLPLEYELAQGNMTIRYTVSKINMNPVPASKFDIPKAGYREMTYEESKKINVAN